MVQSNNSLLRKLTKFLEKKGVLGSSFPRLIVKCLKRNKTVFVSVVNLFLRIGERFELKVYRDLLEEGMVVVDVGANIGMYTFEAAKRVGPTGRVIAFEPDPYNFSVLSQRLKKSKYKNVTLVNEALSDSNGSTKLYIDECNPGNHSFSQENLYRGRGFIQVPTVSLDGYLANERVERVDVIKIDVQGAEGLVFVGAKETLRNNDLKIVMEFWPFGMTQVESDPGEVMGQLGSYGFECKVLDKKTKRLSPLSVNALFDTMESWQDRTDYTNLLLEK